MNFKKSISLVLTLCLVFSLFATFVFPVAAEGTTYTLIDTVDGLTSGTYYMSGVVDTTYHVLTGNIGYGKIYTSAYTYKDGVLATEETTYLATAVEVVAVEGKENTYTLYVADQGYISCADATDKNKLEYSDTACEWEAYANANGGINFKTTVNGSVACMGTNGTSSSQFIRQYKESSSASALTYGLVFFAEDVEEVAPVTSQVVTDWNPVSYKESVGGATGAFIYDDAEIYANCANYWWIHTAFAPSETVEGGYEVVAIRPSSDSASFLTIPENGFVWMAWSSAGDTPDSSGAYALAFMGGLEVGDVVIFNGVDFANHTTTADATAEKVVPPEEIFDAPEFAGENVALNKTYTYPTENLYYHWSDDWPCTDNVATALTDGVRVAGYYGKGETSGWGGAEPRFVDIVIDLEAVYDISGFAYVLTGGADGIQHPETVEISVSTDGVTYVPVSVETVSGNKYSSESWSPCYDLDYYATPAAATAGRYVKFVFHKVDGTNFIFINELEVWGTEAVAVDPDPEELATIVPTSLNYYAWAHETEVCITASSDTSKTVPDMLGGAYFTYWDKAICKWDEEAGTFVVAEVQAGGTADYESTTHEYGTFVLLTWMDSVTDSALIIKNLMAGDRLYFYGDYDALVDGTGAISDVAITVGAPSGDDYWVMPSAPVEPGVTYPDGYIVVNGENGSWQSENATSDLEYAYNWVVDGENLVVTVIVNDDLVSIAETSSSANGTGTNVRLWVNYGAAKWDALYDGFILNDVASLYSKTSAGVEGSEGTVALEDKTFTFTLPLAEISGGNAEFQFTICVSNTATGTNVCLYAPCDTFAWSAWDSANAHTVTCEVPEVPVVEGLAGENVSEWGAGAGFDVLTDGYNGVGEVNNYDPFQSVLYGVSNSVLDATNYTLTFVMDETLMTGVVLYALDFANGGVMLPEAVTVTVNGVDYDAVITANENGIATIAVDFGGLVMTDTVVVNVTMGASPYSFPIFNMYTELETVLEAGIYGDENLSQWNGGSNIDVLFDGYTGVGEVTGYEGNGDKLFGLGNAVVDATAYIMVFDIEETTFDTLTLYTLDYANGGVMLPESVFVLVNGVDYEAVITPNENGIATIVVELGEEVTTTKLVIFVEMAASPYSFGIFHMYTELELSAAPSLNEVDGGALPEHNRMHGALSVPANTAVTYTVEFEHGANFSLWSEDVTVLVNGVELAFGMQGYVAVLEKGDTLTIINENAEAVDTYPSISAIIPGTLTSPIVLDELGDITANVTEEIVMNGGAVHYIYTATADGTLTITMPEGNWTYTVNNLTAGAYGDGQWSDSDPVLSTYSIEVSEGDEIQIIVGTYNPESTWDIPVGELIFKAEFEEASVTGNVTVPDGWGTVDVLIDGYTGVGEITAHDGNHAALVPFKNADTTVDTAYSFIVPLAESTSFNTVTVYILSHTGGNVGLPKTLSVTVNGKTYEAAAVTGDDASIVAIVVDLGETVEAEKLTVNATIAAGSVKYNAYSEIEVSTVAPKAPDVVDVKISHNTNFNWNTYEGGLIAALANGDGKICEVAGDVTYFGAGTIEAESGLYVVKNVGGLYVITEYVTGLEAMKATAIPEGGFLYFVCSGNSDWNTVKGGAILGYIFNLNDIDINSKAAINTAENPAMVATLVNPEALKVGDVNMNGKIDATDYATIRKLVIGAADPADFSELALELADVNGNGKIDANDYILVKRHFLGTYTIPAWAEEE